MLNSITLYGYISRQLDDKTTPSGMRVLTIPVAVVKTYQGKDGMKESTTYWNLKVFGRKIDQLPLHEFTAGTWVYVKGEPDVRNYQDKTGQWKQSLDVNVEQVVVDRFKPIHASHVNYAMVQEAAATVATKPDFSHIHQSDLPF